MGVAVILGVINFVVVGVGVSESKGVEVRIGVSVEIKTCFDDWQAATNRVRMNQPAIAILFTFSPFSI